MSKKNTKINIQGNTITIFKSKEEDYISLTDIAKHKNPNSTGLVISHWLSTRYTVDFMGLWEKMHNPNFNVTEFSNIRNESGSNGFVLSSKNWINSTNAIGIISKADRYGWFISDSSVHESLDWERFCKIEIPILDHRSSPHPTPLTVFHNAPFNQNHYFCTKQSSIKKVGSLTNPVKIRQEVGRPLAQE